MTLLLCIPLTYFMGIEGAIIGLTIVAVIVMGLLRGYIKQAIRKAKFVETIRTEKAWKESSVLWQFALPGFLSGVITSLLLWTGRIILTRQDAGFTELGLFTAADQWRTMVLFMPAIIARVVLPIISSSIHRSSEELKASIGIQVHANGIIALPLAVLLIGFSKPLAAIFGTPYAGTEIIIPMLMVSVYFTAVNQSVRVIYDGVGRRWLNLSMRVLWGIVFLLSSLYYIPRAGALGFAAAHLISEILLLMVQAVVADLALVRGVLRRHTGLFVYSIVLLGAAYGTTGSMSPWMAHAFGLGIFLASCIPAVITFQKQIR